MLELYELESQEANPDEWIQDGQRCVIINAMNCFAQWILPHQKVLKRHFPMALAADRQTARGDAGKLGTCTYAEVDYREIPVVIANIYITYDWGVDKNRIDLEALSRCLDEINLRFPGEPLCLLDIGFRVWTEGWDTLRSLIEKHLGAEREMVLFTYKPGRSAS